MNFMSHRLKDAATRGLQIPCVFFFIDSKKSLSYSSLIEQRLGSRFYVFSYMIIIHNITFVLSRVHSRNDVKTALHSHVFFCICIYTSILLTHRLVVMYSRLPS